MPSGVLAARRSSLDQKERGVMLKPVRTLRLRRKPASKLLPIAVAVAMALLAGAALAASTTLGTGAAKVSGKTQTVVVDSAGVTLYALSGERVGNLKCINAACFKFWPPYKVSANAKLTKTSGVSGTLSKLRRVKGGFYQVMLNGQPLYRFVEDKGKKGSALGQGIKSFGGTWRVIPAR
jgi:predicted lipoprotein with Yx(FWY)xxD motif